MGVNPSDSPVRLSRREQEVAGLVAEGLTNREIAKRLFLSERTVDGHLEHIREKLGVNTRAQIAAWVVRQGNGGVVAAPAEPVSGPRQRWRGLAGRRPWMATALLLAVVASGVVALIVRPWSAASVSGPTIETIAGAGSVTQHFPGAYSGDDGLAINATLLRPSDVVATRDGTIYIADYGDGVVRRIVKRIITTWAGGGSAPLSNGALANTVSLGHASNLAVDAQGRLFLLTNRAGAIEVWMVQPNDTMAFVASGGRSSGGPPVLFFNPPVGGLAVAEDGTLYFADRAENLVWRLAPNGKPTIYAGTGLAGFSGDGGAAIAAQLDHPIGLAIDQQNGDLYIADSGNDCIRRVDTHRVITRVAGSCDSPGDSGDGGPAVKARLNLPFGVAIRRDHTLFIADTGNNRVREITPAGIILAVAGTHRWGFKGDGGPAARAELGGPEAVALDATGDLLIADTENDRVRKLLLSK